ncbi:MAG: FkbM family methyltransferase [Candidatus Omnitrophota bacterium]
MGFKLIGNESMEKGLFEPEETYIVGKLLDQVDAFVNVGANIGYYCCFAMLKNKPTIAFEPDPQNLKFLLKNIKANNWGDKLEIYPVAISSKVGIVDIYGGTSGASTGVSLLPGWANTPSHLVDIVPASTLDLVIGEQRKGLKSLVLMDIEGAEFFALQGASRLIKQTPKPFWVIEICVCDHQPENVSTNPNLFATFSIFWKNGYEAFTATRKPRIITKDELTLIVNGGENTTGTHNFIFADRDSSPLGQLSLS